MASPPFDLDITDPADASIGDAFPANERTFRDNVNSYLNTEHDINTGWHAFQQLTTSQKTSLNNPPTGMLVYDTTLAQLDINTGTPSVPVWSSVVGAVFPSGTQMFFHQATAPTGWAQSAALNDRVLRLISSGSITAGGSWTISGLTASVTVAGHTLTASEIPSHTHQVTAPWANAVVNSGSGAPGVAQQGAGTTSITSDPGTGGNLSHTHSGSSATISSDGTWRPLYADVILAIKS